MTSNSQVSRVERQRFTTNTHITHHTSRNAARRRRRGWAKGADVRRAVIPCRGGGGRGGQLLQLLQLLLARGDAIEGFWAHIIPESASSTREGGDEICAVIK